MKPLKITLICLALSFMSFTTIHKNYISITKIEYAKEKESVQIISRIFIDDFEKLLRERYDEYLTLNVKNEPKIIDTYIQRYIKEKFAIKINDQDADLVFIGKKYEDDVVVCYLEIEKVKEIKSFEVKNKILFDLFSEQQNVVRININSKIKSFILIKENDKGLLNFK